MRQIPVSFYVISKKKKKKRLAVAICPRTGLHDQRVKNDQRLIPAGGARRGGESAPREAASAAASPHHEASGSREGEPGTLDMAENSPTQ